jgi:hypothetical protein
MAPRWRGARRAFVCRRGRGRGWIGGSRGGDPRGAGPVLGGAGAVELALEHEQVALGLSTKGGEGGGVSHSCTISHANPETNPKIIPSPRLCDRFEALFLERDCLELPQRLGVACGEGFRLRLCHLSSVAPLQLAGREGLDLGRGGKGRGGASIRRGKGSRVPRSKRRKQR